MRLNEVEPMSEYTHLLVPTDFSTYSENAARRAKALADVFGARVTLMHVVDYVPPPYISAELPGDIGTPESLAERANAELVDWAPRAGLADAARVVVVGTPKHEIVDYAREHGVDLIVIGTSGMGAMKRILGSTTNRVLHDAPCDVLSAQAPHHE